MKIRTRYTWFKAIIAVAIFTFIVSLFDIFSNDSEWFLYVMAIYVVLAIVALILYIGHKPDLDEADAPLPTPLPEDMSQRLVTEVPRGPGIQGPHSFRCPFCSNIFALELTHLQKRHELRMECPFCSNTIRIPARPKLSPGQPVSLSEIQPAEQAAFSCTNCGEFLRFSAPGQRPEDNARVFTCPHCGFDRVEPAAGAAV